MQRINKNNRRKYNMHFGEDNIVIEGVILNPVHILPDSQWRDNQEIDFYMDDEDCIYLLRLINNEKNIISLCDCNDIRYIIVQTRINNWRDDLLRIIEIIKHIDYKHLKNNYTISIDTNRISYEEM